MVDLILNSSRSLRYAEARYDVTPNEANDIGLFNFDNWLGFNPFGMVVGGSDEELESSWSDCEFTHNIHPP